MQNINRKFDKSFYSGLCEIYIDFKNQSKENILKTVLEKF